MKGGGGGGLHREMGRPRCCVLSGLKYLINWISLAEIKVERADDDDDDDEWRRATPAPAPRR